MVTDYKSIAQKALESGAIKFQPKKKRDYTTKKIYTPDATVIHGKNHTYVTHNCRCDLCCEAHLAYGREYNKTHKRKYKRKNPWCYII